MMKIKIENNVKIKNIRKGDTVMAITGKIKGKPVLFCLCDEDGFWFKV